MLIFEITESNLYANKNRLNLWAKYKYLYPVGGQGELFHIAHHEENFYCSWTNMILVLVWNDIDKQQAHWERISCPDGLRHIGTTYAEGRFEIRQSLTKKCNCPTRALMISGCRCGGK